LAKPKQKIKVRGDHKRASRNERKPRIGQIHVTPRSMPHSLVHRAWLADGSQVAVARSNDRYICGHFDASENPLCGPVVFSGGNARLDALTWLDRQQNVDGI
jgi:hypothetical protein